ncbi:DUF559 domain-containing protein [Demequina sediminicola]|uniref:DUF559 domain-containing protein n=1 Tax=Demequina sediminicola TaxID=1095026 RepID=UPI0007820895|nr:DUF559 domain-containing protein [Demequina sediminicola]
MRLLPRLTLQDAPLADFLGANCHAFTRGELITGWSRRQLDACLRDGLCVRIAPGVYAATTHANAPAVRGEALALWQPRALVTGSLALHLADNRISHRNRADLILAANTHRIGPGWAQLHRTGPVRIRTDHDGVPCVTAERALLDAWRYALRPQRRDVVWEALWTRVCTWRQLARELDRAERVAGRRDLERMLGWFEGGATTPLEVRAQHEVFTGPQFRGFEWQAAVSAGSRRAVVDMLHRGACVAVELDGDRYHSTREARDADRERQTDLAAAGLVVLRFGWNDIAGRPEWCREKVLEVLARRSVA